MTVYLDSNFKCHLDFEEGLMPYETDFFNDKDPAVIPLYRIVPEGSYWVRPSDNRVFWGEMISLV